MAPIEFHDMFAPDLRQRLEGSIHGLAVRTCAENDPLGNEAGERARLLQHNPQIIQTLISEPIDFLLLESRVQHDIGQDS